MILQDDLIYVAGHTGLAGGAIIRALRAAGFTNLLTVDRESLDLKNRDETFSFFRHTKPKHVILAAARVGGILANSRDPVTFLSENLQIQLNCMDASIEAGVRRLVFLSSSCVYPKYANQPIVESSLLTGALEPTNDAYALAKISGMRHVLAVRQQHSRPWISVMPTNLYGPGDTYNAQTSHFLPAMILRYVLAVMHEDPIAVNWGTGTAMRELMYVDDFASALVHVFKTYDDDQHINIGTGEELSINEFAHAVSTKVGFRGQTVWDASRPDGMPRKVLNTEKLQSLGWFPEWDFNRGLQATLEDFYRAVYPKLIV
jgi:GDP-L-fucose synthase